ncbi:hypothetical protein K1719_011596 [Acacia pycnantha]|nr:hypothetical protein K1719_011596 [Acacia pycnantha]
MKEAYRCCFQVSTDDGNKLRVLWLPWAFLICGYLIDCTQNYGRSHASLIQMASGVQLGYELHGNILQYWVMVQLYKQQVLFITLSLELYISKLYSSEERTKTL